MCRIQQDVAIQPIQYFDIIKVSIDIVDINDNEPEFVPNQLIQEMMESASVGTGFVIPAASDPDTRPFSITGYRLVVEDKESEKFELRVVTKMDGSTEVRLMLIEGLDREQRDLHTVKVVAYDGGNPSRKRHPGGLNCRTGRERQLPDVRLRFVRDETEGERAHDDVCDPSRRAR